MPILLSTRALQDDLAFVDDQLRQHSDPYDTVRLMWQQRHEQLQRELSELESAYITFAEVALLFEGSPVRGSEEIKLAFATKMLDQYQALVGTIAAEKGGAVVAAKGQVPRAFTSRLYIKDMLRGSVGFLLEEPKPDQNSLVPTLLKDAVEEATLALSDLASGETEKFNTPGWLDLGRHTKIAPQIRRACSHLQCCSSLRLASDISFQPPRRDEFLLALPQRLRFD